MLDSKKLLQAAVCLFLLTCIVAPATNLAAAEKFQVRLIATIDNGPAMENVEWLVLRPGGEEVERAKKHSTHVNVLPGSYKVVARMTSNDKTVVRTRSFKVRNDINVIVPMDH